MSKKNNNKDSNENDSSEIAKENEKIEELINNPLLLKDYEDLEEEEELENSYTEKEQNMEEIQQYNLIKNGISEQISNLQEYLLESENDGNINKSKIQLYFFINLYLLESSLLFLLCFLVLPVLYL